MDVSIWTELAKAGVAAISAGAQVFASKTKTIEERLSTKPRKAGEDIRDALKEIAERPFED